MQNATGTTDMPRIKTTLWALIGVWAAVTVARFWHGIGATSGLTDVAPWGFWIAFDVMAGVALAAGGFVVAAAVYVFGLKRYRIYARPAILTALLGYMAVAVGLLYDLGLPWHIWHPLIFPQHHSVLFEVAMCVMCYLTVLALEFTPTILEHPLFHHRFFVMILRLVKTLTIPLVIAGIVLSTLHQSSLGALFLIQPFRVHPLWYSPILPVLFFSSAVGLGLMIVTLESLISSRIFGHRLRVDLLAGLARAASVVLIIYAALRVGDLWRRGVLPNALDGSWAAGLFLVELLVSAVVPAVLLSMRRVRSSVAGLTTCSVMTVVGLIGYRFDIAIVAFERPEGLSYFPTWTELAVSVGIIAWVAIVFIFFNENLQIGQTHAGDGDPSTTGDAVSSKTRGNHHQLTQWARSTHRHSLAFIVAASLAVGLLPTDALFGPEPKSTPVHRARTVEAMAIKVDSSLRREIHIASLAGNIPATVDAKPIVIRIIDGNRNWRFVPFTHDDHALALGGQESCRLCHHQNMGLDRNTPCYQCHRDMYEPIDTFEHVWHVYALGANQSCGICHPEGPSRKTRSNARPCEQCHGDMLVPGSLITVADATLTGIAPGYMDAMHGLCIPCHQRNAEQAPQRYGPHFARCDVCHRDFEDDEHRRMAPYVPMPENHRFPLAADEHVAWQRPVSTDAISGRTSTPRP